MGMLSHRIILSQALFSAGSEKASGQHLPRQVLPPSLSLGPHVPPCQQVAIIQSVAPPSLRNRGGGKGTRGMLVCVRRRASRMEDDETKMKEQGWWLSSFTVGRSYSIKP